MTEPTASIVIPVFEEEDSIERLHDEILATMTAADNPEILFVDDHSADGTAAVLARLQVADEKVRVVTLERHQGQSAALQSGIGHARSDRIVTLDGDGQNDPADIRSLIAIAEQGDDEAGLLVVGHRRLRRDNILRRVSSTVANGLRRLVLGDGTPDTGCGIKCFRRQDYLRLPQFDHMHRFLPALFLRQGGRVISVEVGHRPRRAGRAKYGVLNRLWCGIVDLIGVYWLMRRPPADSERFDRLVS